MILFPTVANGAHSIVFDPKGYVDQCGCHWVVKVIYASFEWDNQNNNNGRNIGE